MQTLSHVPRASEWLPFELNQESRCGTFASGHDLHILYVDSGLSACLAWAPEYDNPTFLLPASSAGLCLEILLGLAHKGSDSMRLVPSLACAHMAFKHDASFIRGGN